VPAGEGERGDIVMTTSFLSRNDPDHDRIETEFQRRLSTVAAALTAELETVLAMPVQRSDVRAHVEAALQDLHGSVALEALPEMASRLAAYRWSASNDRASPAEPTGRPVAGGE
jgi:hypothetical protein